MSMALLNARASFLPVEPRKQSTSVAANRQLKRPPRHSSVSMRPLQIHGAAAAAAAFCWLTSSNAVAIAGTPEASELLLDPSLARLLLNVLGPLLSSFNFLFVVRIVMSWYPNKISVDRFPFLIAYAPTEPLLAPTRRLIPPIGGVDIAPVVWVALISFANEVLLGPQGLLVLLSQQQP